MANTWIALLRGINLGRHKRLAMADLRALFEDLGYAQVRTSLQSGNVVFTSSAKSATRLERRIEEQLMSELQFETTVMVRSADELDAVIAGNPFTGGTSDVKQLHALFVSTSPSASKVKALDTEAYAPDACELGDRVVYLHLPNGVMGSRLPDLERVLGVDATMRTWNTVLRVSDLASSVAVGGA